MNRHNTDTALSRLRGVSFFKLSVFLDFSEESTDAELRIKQLLAKTRSYSTVENRNGAHIVISNDTLKLTQEKKPDVVSILLCNRSSLQAQGQVCGITLMTMNDLAKHFRGHRKAQE